jgi:predicted transcriptional regulator
VARERQRRALELRRQGWRLQATADELGVSEAAVRKMLKRALAETVAAIRDDAEGLRALQLEQIGVGKPGDLDRL